jgi:hypothetical protein
MTTHFKPRSLSHSLRALFAPKVSGNPHTRFPDTYYGHFYFTKPLCDGVEFLATCERKSKKQMADELMTLGFQQFVSARIKLYNKYAIAERELEKNPEIVRFITALHRWAKQQGYDISKLI